MGCASGRANLHRPRRRRASGVRDVSSGSSVTATETLPPARARMRLDLAPRNGLKRRDVFFQNRRPRRPIERPPPPDADRASSEPPAPNKNGSKPGPGRGLVSSDRRPRPASREPPGPDAEGGASSPGQKRSPRKRRRFTHVRTPPSANPRTPGEPTCARTRAAAPLAPQPPHTTPPGNGTRGLAPARRPDAARSGSTE